MQIFALRDRLRILHKMSSQTCCSQEKKRKKEGKKERQQQRLREGKVERKKLTEKN